MVAALGLSPQAIYLNDRDLWPDRQVQFIRTFGGNAQWWLSGRNTLARDGRPCQSCRPGSDQFVREHPGLTYLMGNEPDSCDHSSDDMTPEQYRRWYQNGRQYISALDPTARFVTAGIARHNLLPDYLQAVATLPQSEWPDVVSLHAPCGVDATGNPLVEQWTTDLDWQIEQVQMVFPDRDIWVTEFWLGSPAASEEQIITFLRAAVPTLRARPIIARAGWWPAQQSGITPDVAGLLTSDGALTPVGRVYSTLAR